MNELIRENMEFFITLGGGVGALLTGALAALAYLFKHRVDIIKEGHKIEIENLKLDKKESAVEKPLIQEEKVVYVKYLYIRKNSDPPVYKKYIKRIDEEVDIHSEYRYFRFNKYNKKNNEVTIRDRSSGIVDLTIIHPWQDLVFTDLDSKKLKNIVSQDLSGSDTYFTATTYYNGFKEGNEDIAMKMEMDTENARLIADFSSIVRLEKLFMKYPDVYKVKQNGDKMKISGLEEVYSGFYHIHLQNLKKNEVILLDFHVNWDYLNR